MPTAAFVSFRLGLADGVSVTSAAWMRAFTELGYDVRTIAGEGPVDVHLPWLAIGAAAPPASAAARLLEPIAGATVVVVENALSLPMNLPASLAVAEALRDVPTLVHHHDLPWQRARFAHVTDLPVDDPAWRHVTVNRLSQGQLADRGIRAVTIHHGLDLDPPAGDRAATRARLGVAGGETLLLHPVRAIERKDVPRALALAEALGATYWLTGPAEEGYGPRLDTLLACATTRVLRAPMVDSGSDSFGQQQANSYAACDAVLFPSTWEGFGLPPIEAAAHRKPVVVGRYPVAEELRALGFQWLDPGDPAALADAIARPDHEALDVNLTVARAHCSHTGMRERIAAVLAEPGWLDPTAGHAVPELEGTRP